MKFVKTKVFKLINGVISLLLVICLSISMMSLAVYCESENLTDAPEDEASGESAATVVFAKTDIKVGAKFTLKNIELREVKGMIPLNAVTSIDDALGKFATMAITADEYIYSEQMAKTKDEGGPANSRYVNVSNYIKPNSGRDVSGEIQNIIDDNPKSTIYFPDGEYIISRSLRTHGDPYKAVSFQLADGAIIKAAENWVTEKGCDCLISFGVYESFNKEVSQTGPLSDVVTVGSYFWIQGGTLDGNGKANGISLDGGRETLVKNVLIKNVDLGVRINIGVNNKSSDMDLDDVTIICNPNEKSVGIEVWGYDNTISNVHIYDAKYGVTFPKYTYTSPVDGQVTNDACSGGNAFRDVKIIRTENAMGKMTYNDTIGINEGTHGNMYYHCYVENYARAYRLMGNIDVLDSCKAKWVGNSETRAGTQIAVSVHNRFHLGISCFRAEFAGGWAVLESSNRQGGLFESLITNDTRGLPPQRYATVPTK